MLIDLIAWETPNNAVLPACELDVCEGMRYANLWDWKDSKSTEENNFFWVLFDHVLAASIHSRLRLSPEVYEKYKGITEFHVTMHSVHIRAHKDHTQYNLSYIATEAEIDQLIATWPPAWKLGFKSSALVIVGTSRKDTAPKDTVLASTTKETKVCSTEKTTMKENPKDATKGAEQ